MFNELIIYVRSAGLVSLIQFHLLESYKFANFGRETVRSLAGVGRSSILEQKHVVAGAGGRRVRLGMHANLPRAAQTRSVRPSDQLAFALRRNRRRSASGREGLGREGRSAAEPAIHN